jgi:hypothetical protein
MEEYNRYILDELAESDPIEIGSVVSLEYVFDFLILYESIAESWTFYPFRLHAFVIGREAYETLSSLELPDVEVHLLPAEPGDWGNTARTQIRLVEHAGLERCIISDVDNVFLSETPELFMLLDSSDFVFVGSPHKLFPLQTGLWSFRRNDRSISFSRNWYDEAADREAHDASGLPFALMRSRNEDLKVKVLVRPKPESNANHYPSPYDVQANIRPIYISKDPLGLGFREPEMGRAKVVHLAGLRAAGHASLSDRLEAVVRRFPESSQFLPLYATLATRAARRLGMEVLASPSTYMEQQFRAAGIVLARNELPELLNARGFLGRGVEVGVADGRFSAVILSRWRGQHLLSVDPWLAAPFHEYVDVSNVAQETQDALHDITQRRLARFGERSSIWRMTSAEAAARIEENSLDFVYLDARHDYASVKQDLELWYGKIHGGGLFAGHDYLDGDLPQGMFGVQSAVREFFAARGLPVKTTALDEPWVSWFVEIPKLCTTRDLRTHPLTEAEHRDLRLTELERRAEHALAVPLLRDLTGALRKLRNLRKGTPAYRDGLDAIARLEAVLDKRPTAMAEVVRLIARIRELP